MYKKILVPLDGSRTAEAVLPQVRELAKLSNAAIVLMNVQVDPFWESLLIGPKLAATAVGTASVADKATSYLLSVASSLASSGLEVSVHVANGLVAESILGYAEEIQADLIVMSSRGQSRFMEQPLGSVAYQIARRSKTQVLLVRQSDAAMTDARNAPARALHQPAQAI